MINVHQLSVTSMPRNWRNIDQMKRLSPFVICSLGILRENVWEVDLPRKTWPFNPHTALSQLTHIPCDRRAPARLVPSNASPHTHRTRSTLLSAGVCSCDDVTIRHCDACRRRNLMSESYLIYLMRNRTCVRINGAFCYGLQAVAASSQVDVIFQCI